MVGPMTCSSGLFAIEPLMSRWQKDNGWNYKRQSKTE
jgi:hypothetical protein